MQSQKLTELSTVYNLQPSGSFSASPFQSSGTLEALQSTIHSLSIPKISALSSLPPIQLTTLLSHLSHLLRLVSLYLSISLPYPIERASNRTSKDAETEGKKEKGKLILENLIRLAFNYAYVLWKRGETILETELDDLGELVRRVLDL